MRLIKLYQTERQTTISTIVSDTTCSDAHGVIAHYSIDQQYIVIKFNLNILESETLKAIVEKLANLTDEMRQSKVNVALVANLTEELKQSKALAEENRKRLENVDHSFERLCPLFDKIYDVASAPGGKQYDCCYEPYSGATGRIGNGMACMEDSVLGLTPDPPFNLTETGVCSNNCGTVFN